MKSLIATVAIVSALGLAPAFAMDTDVNANARAELLSTARGEVAAPTQRVQIETSAQSSAPKSTVDNVR
jgi:hypothetical protein